ncbi:hypothetical protein ACLH0K_12175 [Arthrobacter sp. MPF02]|uniref:hypothetical protein n=1 Tax=Arthrobacter sp. MPF02 TaxID=3388492 RepID=UPI0039855CF0
MGNVYGADVVQLRQLAASLRSAGRRLEGQQQSLTGQVTTVRWPGPDAERFRQAWQASDSSSLLAAALFLNTAAEAVLRHAQEQEAASSAGAGTGNSRTTLMPSPGTGSSPGSSRTA